MNKFVFTVFKAIAMAMIFVFVFDMVFYLYRALSINQRMLNLMTSMQQVVMDNNYLPQGDYNLYRTLFQELASNYNDPDGDGVADPFDKFVNGFNINYNHDAHDCLDSLVVERYQTSGAGGGSVVNSDVLRKRMDIPANYGDVMVVQVDVEIRQPVWGFDTSAPNVAAGGERGSTAWQNDRTSANIRNAVQTFTYTYYVPCLKYQSITE